MKQFDLKRFGHLLKYHFSVTGPTWLRILGVYTIVLFLVSLFNTRVKGIDYTTALENNDIEFLYTMYADQIRQTALFGEFFLFIAMLFGAANIFSHLKSKPQRSTYLTLPASNLEKYLVSFLHAVVLLCVGTILAYCVADTLRMLLDLMTGRIVVWGVPMYFSRFSNFDAPWLLPVWALGILLYLHSVYILGGTLFRKLKFLMTSFFVIIGFIFVMWAVYTTRDWIDWQEFPKSHNLVGEGVFHPLFYVFTILSYLLTAFHYWLSYRIFCRMQVNNHKWLNV